MEQVINNIENISNNNNDKVPTCKIEDKLEYFTDWVKLHENEFVTFSFKNPYLYININKEYPEENDVENLFKFMNKFYYENENLMFGKIYNLSNMGMVGFSEIHKFSNNLTKLGNRTNKQVYSSSIIIKNVVVRKVLDMFLTLYQNTRPIKVVDNLKDAKLFIKDEKRKYNETNELRSINPEKQGVL